MSRAYYVEVIKWLRLFSKKRPLSLTHKEALDIRRQSKTNYRLPPEMVLDDLIRMGLLREGKSHQFDILVLTDIGKTWVAELETAEDLLHVEQRKYIAEYFLTTWIKDEHILSFFQLFHIDSDGIFFVKRTILNEKEERIALMLAGFEILSLVNGNYVLDKQFIDKVMNIVNTSAMSENKLLEKLEHIREIGQDGEQWVVQHEKNRLEELFPGHECKVERVSETNVALGYDVHSFIPVLEERFIEVKTCSSEKINFYLTSNELQKSEKYGDNYWLYVLVAKKEGKDPKECYKIQNPARFFKEKDIAMKPVLFEVSLRKEVIDED